MKQTITYILMLFAAIAISFGFSTVSNEGKVHLKVTKEENGQHAVFEKTYDNMEALKADEELKTFDVLINDWTDDQNHMFIHEDHDGEEGHKKVIIKKRIDGDEEFTWTTEEEEIHEGEKHIIIKKKGSDEEIIEVEGEKIIKIKTDGDEQIFTITSKSEGDGTMVWIDEDGKKTELTEEHIEKMAEGGEKVVVQKKIKVITSNDDEEKNVFIIKEDSDGEMVWIDEDGNKTKLSEEKIAELKEKHKESGDVHKKVEVIVSGEDDEKKQVIIMKGDDEDMTDIEVEVEKEIDDDGNEVIKDKKVWITKDGERVELDDENAFEFKTEGDNITIKVDDETIDIADFSNGKFEGENVMVFKTKASGEKGMKQTMDVSIEEKDGEKYIEIDIKRDAEMNVTISDILKNDDALSEAKFDLKNNLKASQLSYYPNPNNGKFNLKFSLDHKDEVTVSVLDILGNRIYNEKLMDFEGLYDNEINLLGKESGIYILQISQKKKALTRKILIE